MKRHVKIGSELFLNDWDALMVKDPLTGCLCVRTFQRSFFPKDVAKMMSTVQVAGCGPIYDDFMAQDKQHCKPKRTRWISKFQFQGHI
jgi:hypothetical protein